MIPPRPHSLIPALAVMFLSAGFAAATDVPQGPAALAKSLISNPSFEQVYTKDGAFVPNDWSFNRWDNKDTILGTVEETPGATAKMAVKLPACGPGGIGFGSAAQPLSGNFQSLLISLRVKKSPDFTANPWVVLAWFKGSSFLGTTDLKTDIRSNDWETISQEIPRSAIPAGADHFCLNIAELGKPGATGFIWYDDAIVMTDLDAQSVKPVAQTAAPTPISSVPTASTPAPLPATPAGASQSPASLAKSLISNPSFAQVYAKDGAFVPNDWSFQRWDNKDAIVGTVEETPGASAKMAVKLPACGPGGIGFSSSAQPLNGDFQSLLVSLRVKKSPDFTANPWVFITWFKGTTHLGNTDLKTAIRSNEWETISQEIPRSAIPAGADSFRLNIAELGKPDATGFIWYDDAIVVTKP